MITFATIYEIYIHTNLKSQVIKSTLKYPSKKPNHFRICTKKLCHSNCKIIITLYKSLYSFKD